MAIDPALEFTGDWDRLNPSRAPIVAGTDRGIPRPRQIRRDSGSRWRAQGILRARSTDQPWIRPVETVAFVTGNDGPCTLCYWVARANEGRRAQV